MAATDARRVVKGLAWGLPLALLALLWWFPDAVSRIRQHSAPYAGMPTDCLLAEGPCTATFADGREVRLTLTPGRPQASSVLTFHLHTPPSLTPRQVQVQGLDMNMGLATYLVTPGPDPGTWTASGALPICTEQTMTWRADVLFDDRSAGFTFSSVR